MILISHRGNLSGKNPTLENKPSYITKALKKGFAVEVDVWYDNGWWLGHDNPKYKTTLIELLPCWCHAKNMEALEMLKHEGVTHYFWHQNDDYTLTSSGYIWTHVGKPLVKGSICVLPEQYEEKFDMINVAGICSDNIIKYRK